MVTPQFIAKNWPLSDVALGKTFVSYPTRQVVEVFAKQGAFVAKIDQQPPIDHTDPPFAVFDFLTSLAFPHVPALLKTNAGNRHVDLNQSRIVLMEYLAGEQPSTQRATWEELGAIARKLNSFSGYPYPYAIDTSAAIGELEAQAEMHPQREQFHGFIAMLAPIVHTTHHGLIHGEINLANTARRGDGTLVLLDWDEAGHGPTLIEAGYPLIVVFLTEDLQFQREPANGFYRQYYAGRGLTAQEKDDVFRAALFHALRYMPFANQQKRWERVCFAVAHQAELMSALP